MAPELFAANATTMPIVGYPPAVRNAARAKTCAKNAKLLLAGKAPVAHVDKEMPKAAERPMMVNMGHGVGGYGLFDSSFT